MADGNTHSPAQAIDDGTMSDGISPPSPVSSGSGTLEILEERERAEEEDSATSRNLDYEPPVAARKTKSVLREEGYLEELRGKYDIPQDHKLCLAGEDPACSPQIETSVVIYEDALEAGLRLPLHSFHILVLRRYGLAPSQLMPNAWGYMAAFIRLCERARVEPTLSVFKCFFRIYADNVKSPGWYYFRLLGVRPLFAAGKTKSSYQGDWRSRFFIVQSPSTTPWRCPVRWGKPTKEAVVARPTPSTNAAKDTLLSFIDVGSFVSGYRDRLPAGVHLPPTPEQLAAVKLEDTAGDQLATCTRKRKSPPPPPPPPPRSQHRRVETTTPPRGSSAQPGAGARPPRPSCTTRDRDVVESVAGALEVTKMVFADLETKIQQLNEELQVQREDDARLRDQLWRAREAHIADAARHAEELQAVRLELQVTREAHIADAARHAEELQAARLELRLAREAHIADVDRHAEELQAAKMELRLAVEASAKQEAELQALRERQVKVLKQLAVELTGDPREPARQAPADGQRPDLRQC